MNAEQLLALYEQVAEASDAVPRLRRFVLDLAVRGKLVPQANGAQATRPASTTRPVAVSPTNRACLAQLGDSGARFTPLPDRYFEGGCSNLGTIQLDGLRGDRSAIGVTHLGATACTTAAAFAGWARTISTSTRFTGPIAARTISGRTGTIPPGHRTRRRRWPTA